MSGKWIKRIVRYGTAGAIGAVLVVMFLTAHGFWELESPVERYRVLTDAFTVPGLLMLCIGMLVWISDKGVFNPIAYAFRYLAAKLLPFAGIEQEHYVDYVERKREEHVTGYGFLLITGAVFFAIALFFLTRFYQYY